MTTMTHQCAAATLMLLLSGPAAHAVTPWGQGMGVEPCSSWTAGRDAEAVAYISGFWSALNYVGLVIGRNDGRIGERTGPQAIVDEVRQACRASPALVVNQAVLNAYDRVRVREAGQAK